METEGVYDFSKATQLGSIGGWFLSVWKIVLFLYNTNWILPISERKNILKVFA